MTAYIYLHGFASSPRSSKAQYLRDRFAKIGFDYLSEILIDLLDIKSNNDY